MEPEFYTFKKDDKVCVRDGYKDDDTGTDLSGWTGTVIYAETGGMVLVKWTQETLARMPQEYIDYMEESDLGIDEYELYDSDILPLTENPVSVSSPSQSYSHEEDISKEVSFPKTNEITALPEKFRVITHFIIFSCLLIPYSYFWGYISYYSVLQMLEGDFEFVISWMGFVGFLMVNLFMLIFTLGVISRIKMLMKHRMLKEKGVRTFVEIIRVKHRSGRLAAQYAEFEFRGMFVRQQVTHMKLAKLKRGDKIEIIYLPEKPEILTMVR